MRQKGLHRSRKVGRPHFVVSLSTFSLVFHATHPRERGSTFGAMIEVVLNDRLGKKVRVKCK